MTPITDERFVSSIEPRLAKMRKEIEEFIAHPCLLAELWTDDSVTITTNRDSYARVLRCMRLDRWRTNGDGKYIQIRSHNKKIIAEKRGEWGNDT